MRKRERGREKGCDRSEKGGDGEAREDGRWKEGEKGLSRKWGSRGEKGEETEVEREKKKGGCKCNTDLLASQQLAAEQEQSLWNHAVSTMG
eukprot:2701221-Pleurochrysis_carterae.AAC.1